VSAPNTSASPVGGAAPTGEQYVITRGLFRATITEVAAALREFTVDGVDLTEPYPRSATPPFADGISLAPWPNRVADGLWHLNGKPQQLDITETDKHNALHGLLRYTGFRLVERTDASVTLGAHVFPQHGYPFHLDTTVRYELVDGGLEVTHTVLNLSDAAAPVALGAHPFLTIGDVPTADLTLTVHASTRFEVDARLNPIREIPVEGTYDLRAGRSVGELDFDDAFGGVETVHDAFGGVRTVHDAFGGVESRYGVSAVLAAPDGRRVLLVQDENHGYVQVFTTRGFPKHSGGGNGEPGLAVAVEPMTAPPDAFNSGLGLRWVEPGETWRAGWGIQYRS
jgi:aldose 1-epimerase